MAKYRVPNRNYRRLKLLMLCRVVFAVLLLASSFLFHLGHHTTVWAPPYLMLHGLIVFIFLITCLYAALIRRIKKLQQLAFFQICLDTLIVTLMIYLTGGFASFYSFLYPVVILYASLFLDRHGNLVVATLSSVQYVFLIGLEFSGLLVPFVIEGIQPAWTLSPLFVGAKTLLVSAACFVVAILSSFLSEQTRKSKGQLEAMQDHIQRVEQMASLGEMAAGLAHEIKNPLASLTGSIQLLRDDAVAAGDQDKLMQIVLREADRLSGLVNNFLLFAKPPTGQSQPIALAEMIDETVSLLEKDASWRGRINFRKSVAPGTWVEIDPVHLRQVLWNLMLNAAEAIEDQGEIEIKVQQNGHRFVRVMVCDTGIGICSEKAKKIFRPFYTTKANGTGLGLSIVHSILDSCGSRIEIQSRLGNGSTFSFFLKAIESPA